MTATLVQHSCRRGEVGHALGLSQTTARCTVFDYALGLLQQSPCCAERIASTTASEIRLHNGLIIATIRTATDQSVAALAGGDFRRV